MGVLKKKIILVGRAASGKTTLKNLLIEKWNLKPEISYTTRAIRPGEKDGTDYHFVTKSVFEQMIADGKMLEYDNFNGNFYGTTLEEFNDCDIMIMTPEGINHASRVRSVCFVIYLFASQSIIMDRLSSRHGIKSKDEMRVIHERINADNLQFVDFEKSRRNFDIEVDSSMPMDLMLSQIKKYENQYK